MKHALLFSAFLLSSAPAFANEEGFDKEKAYLVVCRPGSAYEKSVDAKAQASYGKLRADIQAFLRNPAPIVRQLEEAFDRRSETDLLEQAGLQLGHLFSCGLAEILGPDIEARGCVSESGEKISAQKANELCAPLNKKMKETFGKANENAEDGEKEGQ